MPLSYSIKTLLARKAQFFLTVFGNTLVVFIFLASMMLAEGIRYTLASTGESDNVIVLSIGAQNEIQSGISRENVAIISARPEIAKVKVSNTPNSSMFYKERANIEDKEGAKESFVTELVESADIVVVVTLPKKDGSGTSNVTLRGVGENARIARPQVNLISGRLPRKGTREVIVGSAISTKFANVDLGKNIRLAGADWTVVGLFDAGRSAFNSEIWGDADILMGDFNRTQFSSLLIKLAHGVSLSSFKESVDSDKRLNVNLLYERDYYESQSKTLSTFIKIIGGFVSFIFCFGAVIGSFITMYSSVSSRIREIGILRAIGFSKWGIIISIMQESFVIGICGSLLALLFSLILLNLTFSTTNFDSFSDIAFCFTLTPKIALNSLLFGSLMAVVGALFPAIVAGRVDVVRAIRRMV